MPEFLTAHRADLADDHASLQDRVPLPTPGKRTLVEQLYGPPHLDEAFATMAPADPLISPGGAVIQRAAASDGACAERSSINALFGGPASGDRSSTGSGELLEPGIRRHMERAFSTDFSSVRVHHGDQARSLGALAYTQGEDLHFAPGNYDPASAAGRALIGHELAHVVQQRAGRVATPQAKPGTAGASINADANLEREADQLGERAARGEIVAAGSSSPAAAAGPIQRKIGFEFEMNVPLYHIADNDIDNDSDDETADFVTAPGVAPKTVIQDNGYDGGGFKIVADHGDISEASTQFRNLYAGDVAFGGRIPGPPQVARLEFVTKELDETAANYEDRLHSQLYSVMTAMEHLRKLDMANNSVVLEDPYCVGIPTHMRPPRSRTHWLIPPQQWAGIVGQLRQHVHYRLYMQATAGIAPSAMPDLLDNTPANAPFLDKDVHQMILDEIDDSAGNIVGAIVGLQRPASFVNQDRDVLDGFFSLICQYLWGSEVWTTARQLGGDSRNFVPFFSRVDLVRLRNGLSQGAREFLLQHGLAVRNALLAENDRIAQVVTNTQPRTHASVILAEAFIPAVITGNNIDGVTGTSFSLDVLPTGTNAAPVEFRSIVAHPLPTEIIQEAMVVVNRVRQLNHGK